MPVSKTSISGLMPRATMVSANRKIMSGALTEAWVGKLKEPVVRLARSGFASPSRNRTSARRSKSWKIRPLVETQISRSEASRILRISGA